MRAKIIRLLVAMIALMSVMVMGCESPYFPWPNWGGLVILAIIVARINRPFTSRF